MRIEGTSYTNMTSKEELKIDMEKVQRLKELIKNNEFQINADHIAQKLIEKKCAEFETKLI